MSQFPINQSVSGARAAAAAQDEGAAVGPCDRGPPRSRWSRVSGRRVKGRWSARRVRLNVGSTLLHDHQADPRPGAQVFFLTPLLPGGSGAGHRQARDAGLSD